MSELSLVADILVRATPLILAGLAVALAFRGGVFNIGAEGQLLAGAVASTWVLLSSGASAGLLSTMLALGAGSAAGAAWAAIAAELKRRFHVLEIISTLMLNFIAIHLVSFLVRGPLQEPTRIYPQTLSVPEQARLPALIADTRLHAGFLIAVLVAFTLRWFFRSTAAGFRVRVVGESPAAAWSAGLISVNRTTFLVFLASGALAGLAGAIEIAGVTFALYENVSPGYGYTAIAVALIAGLNPALVVLSGIFFAILETGAIAMQRDFGVPSSLAYVAEALLILAALFAGTRRLRSVSYPGGVAHP